MSHRFRKLSFGYVSPNLIRMSQVAQRILEKLRDFLDRLCGMEQAVAVVVYERRWISPARYQCCPRLARPRMDLERCLASLVVEGGWHS